MKRRSRRYTYLLFFLGIMIGTTIYLYISDTLSEGTVPSNTPEETLTE
jgi:hypothetical protein